MDYVVGSVAALVSGNVTPNRPRVLKRALTPTKHQPSPNVTPKSEFVDDRSIFMSPTLQKKKAIVKKSPKRIFQNPDLDVTNEGDGNSEKANKVKKHLKEELDGDKLAMKSPGQQKDATEVKTSSTEGMSPKKKIKNISEEENEKKENNQMTNENTPKKKKKQRNSASNTPETAEALETNSPGTNIKIKVESVSSPKKIKKEKNLVSVIMKQENEENLTNIPLNTETVASDGAQTTPKKKKNRKRNKNAKASQSENVDETTEKSPVEEHSSQIVNKKRKLSETVNQEPNFIKIFGGKTVETLNQKKSKKQNKRKKKSKHPQNTENDKAADIQNQVPIYKSKIKKNKSIKSIVNPNAITNKDNDSDHESDDKINSDNEEANNEIFNANNQLRSNKKNKRKKKSKALENTESNRLEEVQNQAPMDESKSNKKKNKKIVNPNAITNEDTDSEHESDDEINSENEEANNEILNGSVEGSSDDEDEEANATKTVKKKVGAKQTERTEINMEEELKRTLFVGNVTYTLNCKKELKKIFRPYGVIQSIRFRTIPIRDARLTPKLAVIKNELHPERSTVNAYIKYKDADSVDKALAENNTLFRDKHLRVTRSDTTGDTHDPKASVFVGNLPFALEDEALREKFEKCGEIESVRIVRDKKTNIGKGFGYVNFTSKDAVELALSLTDEDLTIKNRILRVKRCTHTNKSHDTTSNQSMNSQRDFNDRGRDFSNRGRDFNSRGRGFNNRGRGFNNRGRGFNSRGGTSLNRGEYKSFNDIGERDFNTRGGSRERGGHRGGRGGHRGGRGGSNFSSRGGQRNFNNRSEDDQTKGYQQGRSDKNDIGAFRRIQNKRQYQEGGSDGPPNKRPKSFSQPTKEKKPRKEFVGMTAEKKKKHKNNKSQGMRQKKALSEILSK